VPSLIDLQSQLRAQCAPASHLARIRDLVVLAEREPSVVAILLVGSYAKGRGDRVSDLDLVAIATPGHEGHVLHVAQLVLRSNDLLHQFIGRHSAGGAFWKAIYLDFSSVELHVFEPSTSFRLKRPYLTIWDPSNLLPSYVVDGEAIQHEDFAAYEYGDEGLIWELIDCIKWLSRGRTELAKRHIMKIAAQLSSDANNA
jgi:predicted nucleotidyltransferase